MGGWVLKWILALSLDPSLTIFWASWSLIKIKRFQRFCLLNHFHRFHFLIVSWVHLKSELSLKKMPINGFWCSYNLVFLGFQWNRQILFFAVYFWKLVSKLKGGVDHHKPLYSIGVYDWASKNRYWENLEKRLSFHYFLMSDFQHNGN